MKTWFKFKPTSIVFSILLLSYAATSNLQTAVALTPVADLTGQWSGFAQLSSTEGYCEFTGKINAKLVQNGNDIKGKYSFVQTGAKSSNPDVYHCDLGSFEQNIHGTIDGSRITLYSDDATFSGWYASAGIKIDVISEDLTGKAQLSPTGFTPLPYQPKDGGEEAKKKAAEEEKKKKAAEEEKKKAENATKKEAWIDVRATHIGGILKNFPIWHLLIVYHGTDDLTYFYRGGPSGGSPEPYGLIIGTSGLYKPGTVDYDINSPSKRVITGKDAEGKNLCFQKELDRIDSSKIAYKPRGPNSNSVAYTLLVNCDVPAKKPVNIAPGWGTLLK